MKKRFNPLLTALLAGSMLLGTAGIAMASPTSSSTAAASNCPTSVQCQRVNTPFHAELNFKLGCPTNYVTSNRAHLSAILDNLVTDGTITASQEKTILSKLTVNHSIYNLLSRLVTKGAISQAQMDAIISSVPTEATMNSCSQSPNALWVKTRIFDKNQKDQSGPVAKAPQQRYESNPAKG